MKQGGGGGPNVESKTQLPQWDKDWNLQPMNAHGLVDEYLEMGKTFQSFKYLWKVINKLQILWPTAESWMFDSKIFHKPLKEFESNFQK